jgi:hypothetical protein
MYGKTKWRDSIIQELTVHSRGVIKNNDYVREKRLAPHMQATTTLRKEKPDSILDAVQTVYSRAFRNVILSRQLSRDVTVKRQSLA